MSNSRKRTLDLTENQRNILLKEIETHIQIEATTTLYVYEQLYERCIKKLRTENDRNLIPFDGNQLVGDLIADIKKTKYGQQIEMFEKLHNLEKLFIKVNNTNAPSIKDIDDIKAVTDAALYFLKNVTSYIDDNFVNLETAELYSLNHFILFNQKLISQMQIAERMFKETLQKHIQSQIPSVKPVVSVNNSNLNSNIVQAPKVSSKRFFEEVNYIAINPQGLREFKIKCDDLRKKITKERFMEVWNSDPRLMQWFKGLPLHTNNSEPMLYVSTKAYLDVFINVLNLSLEPSLVENMLKGNKTLIHIINNRDVGDSIHLAMSNYIITMSYSNSNYEFLDLFSSMLNNKPFYSTFYARVNKFIQPNDKSENARFLLGLCQKVRTQVQKNEKECTVARSNLGKIQI